MAEYIDRYAAIQFAEKHATNVAVALQGAIDPIAIEVFLTTKDCIKDYLSIFPAADVAEVKHGAWKLESEIHKMLDDVDEEFYVKCPFCNRTEWVGFDFEPEKMLEWARKEYPYCHCGAKMDGKENAE